MREMKRDVKDSYRTALPVRKKKKQNQFLVLKHALVFGKKISSLQWCCIDMIENAISI